MNEAEQLELSAFWKRYLPEDSRGSPKHAVLGAALSAAIVDGFWKPGEKLPTEAELAASTPYSLGTIQRALRDLVNQGLVERRRRHGTFVPDRQRQLHDAWHCRFLGDDGSSFLPVYTKVIGRAVTERHGPWSRALEQDSEAVICIDRLMEINSEFTVYSKFYVRADRFPGFLSTPVEELAGANLKVLIIRALGSPLTLIKEQVRMASLPPYVCEEINVANDTVGLHVTAIAHAGEGPPVYYQELYIPPTERRLYVESSMPSTGW